MRKPPSKISIFFGKKLRAQRIARGLSQEKLAELAALHLTYISDVERGVVNISLESLARLAKALRCQPHELLKPE